MTVVDRVRPAKSTVWGWSLIALVCALLLTSAAWLFSAVGTPAVFEADTGVSAAEFLAAYPSVAAELEGRGRTIALLVAALAALALMTTIAGWRSGAAWTHRSLWVFAAALLAIGASAVASGRADVGSFHLGAGLLAAVGLLMARRHLAP